MTKACLAAFFERQVQPVESVESDHGTIFCDASILSNYYAHYVCYVLNETKRVVSGPALLLQRALEPRQSLRAQSSTRMRSPILQRFYI